MSSEQRPDQARPARKRASSGLVASGLVAPTIALVALVLIAAISVNALSLGAGSPPDDASLPPGQTDGPVNPRPSRDPDVVVTPPPDDRTEVRGTLLFARTGNIWAAHGTELTQLSDTGIDAFPVWEPDGSGLYFIETRTMRATAPYQGGTSRYTHEYPVIMHMEPDGSERTEIQDSLIDLGRGNTWFMWLLQPSVSPDGSTFALVSDGPDATVEREVVLSLLPTSGGKIRPLPIRFQRPYGHNDPAWSPDGTKIAFTYNTMQGDVGAPRIGIYDRETEQLRLLRQRGYADPSWSPDGRYLAAVKTDGNGRDIVILDSTSGAEVIRLTRDGGSFAPTFSPDGSQIAYLHLKGQGIDLRLLTLRNDGTFTLELDKAVTEDGSLDPASPPAWFMPGVTPVAPPQPTPIASFDTGSSSSVEASPAR